MCMGLSEASIHFLHASVVLLINHKYSRNGRKCGNGVNHPIDKQEQIENSEQFVSLRELRDSESPLVLTIRRDCISEEIWQKSIVMTGSTIN